MSESNPHEKALLEAGERLGECMKSVSDAEKEVLRGMYGRVDGFVKDIQQQGRYLDRSAVFACAIAVDDRIQDASLIDAAKQYIEQDYLFVKHLKEAGATQA